MIREIGRFTTLSALLFSLQRGTIPFSENPLESKSPDSPSKVMLVEGLRAVIPEGIKIPDSRRIGTNRLNGLRNGHTPEILPPGILSRLALLYPENR